VRKLHADKLTTLTRLLELEREAAQLEGNRGQITSEIAQASGRIAELELQILQIDQELRSEAGGQLSDLRARLSEVIQRKSAAADELRRLDIRAPQEGTVLQLAVHTVGGVIEAGELLMLIVPEADPLAVEARVSPTEIDRLHVGQSVMLRFPSFNQQTTPQITGKLARISPDSTEDKRTGMSYYTLQIVIPVDQIRRLGEAKLLPGMPVEAFIATEERTVLSYLAKPLSDHLTRAFRQR
jgi:HlyD family secretion protein